MENNVGILKQNTNKFYMASSNSCSSVLDVKGLRYLFSPSFADNRTFLSWTSSTLSVQPALADIPQHFNLLHPGNSNTVQALLS